MAIPAKGDRRARFRNPDVEEWEHPERGLVAIPAEGELIEFTREAATNLIELAGFTRVVDDEQEQEAPPPEPKKGRAK